MFPAFPPQVTATLINSALLFPLLLLCGGLATRAAAKPNPCKEAGGATPADSEAGGDKAALLCREKASAQKGLPKPLGVALFVAWAVLLVTLWAWSDLPGAPRMVRPSLQPHPSPARSPHACIQPATLRDHVHLSCAVLVGLDLVFASF